MKITQVGIFGGSFDPPHVGHVALVEEALVALDLPEIWVVPAGNPVHRRLSGRADADLRMIWLKRIFNGREGILMRDWEIQCEKPVPTIITLRRIRKDFPNCRPVLLLGADAFAGMREWVKYPEHQGLCDVAVFDRAGCASMQDHEWRQVSPRQWREGAERETGRLVCIRAQLPDVSATTVRKRAASGESLAGLVPGCVREDIEKAYGSACGNKD